MLNFFAGNICIWNFYHFLTHWGRVTHICISNLALIGSDNGLSPGQRQAIISTNAEILLIGHLGTNFDEILIEIRTFSFNKMHLKLLSAKWERFYQCVKTEMVQVVEIAPHGKHGLV